MAEIRIDPTIDPNSVRRGERATLQALDKIEKQADSTTESVAAVGTQGFAVLREEIAALVAVATPAAIFTASIQASREFEKSLSALSAITGAVGKDLEFFSEQAALIGRTTTLSASQAAEAFQLIASAQPQLLQNAEALTAVTKEAVALAEATGTALPEAADVLGSALNQFQVDAENAGRFINVLAAGAQLGAESSLPNLALALKNAGTTASATGLSFEQANAALQVLAASAIRGGEAGTALRNTLLILETAADEQLRPSVVGLNQALANAAPILDDTAAAAKLFGRENINAARVLINSRDEIDKLTTAVTGTSTAYEQASTRTNNLDGDLRALASAAEGAGIAIGEAFTGEAREAVQGITVAINGLTDNFEAFSNTVTAVATTAIGVKLVQGLGTLTVSLTTVGGAANVASAALSRLGSVAAVATRAMAALGGPVGVVTIAAAGFVAWNQSTTTAATNTKNLSDEIDTLIGNYDELNQRKVDDLIERQRQAIANLQEQLRVTDTSTILDAELSFENLGDRALETLGNIFKSEDELRAARTAAGRERLADQQRISKELIDAERGLNALLQQRDQLLERQRDTEAQPLVAPPAPADTAAFDKLRLSLEQQLELTKATEREQAVLQSLYQLGADATFEQVDAIAALTGALFDQQKAQEDLQQQAREREALRGETESLLFGLLSPVDQLQARAEQELELLNQAFEQKLITEQQYADASIQLQTRTQQQQQALAAQQRQLILSSGEQFFDSLAGLAEAAAGEQSGAYRVLFGISKGFALANSVLNLQLALSQALADPSALTLPQKIANYATIASTAGAVVSNIAGLSPKGFADGGFVSGPGTGRSDSIPARLSDGEFVVPAPATRRNRAALETMRAGGTPQGGMSLNIEVINEVPGAQVQAQQMDDGRVRMLIRQETPGIMAAEASNPNSRFSKQQRANQVVQRKVSS